MISDNGFNKVAYVPLTPAAQGQPPMDPAMMGGQPPMDPSMGGQGMPMDPTAQGGGQVDPETGLVIVDATQGLVMDPNTGIMLNKQTGEFMSPEGQPIPPEQAIQMIEQAAAQMGGGQPPMDPSMAGGQGMSMPPADPSMMGGDPAMIAQGGMPPMDPAMAASGGMMPPPTEDPAAMTGGALPPAPQEAVNAMGASAGAVEGDIESMMPGFEEFIAKNEQQAIAQDKTNKRVIKEIAGARADMQGMRRELEQLEDTQDVLLARLTDVVDRFERAMGGQVSGGPLNA